MCVSSLPFNTSRAGCSGLTIRYRAPEFLRGGRDLAADRPARAPTAAAADRPRSAGSRGRGSGRRVCQAAAPHEFSRFTPSAPSRSLARRRAAARRAPTAARSSALDAQQVGRVRARDHERVPARRRGDVHEGDRALVFVDDRRGQLAGDDLAEDAVGVAHRAQAYSDRLRACRRTSARDVGERLLARGDLARVLGLGELARAARRRAGPAAMPSSRASSSPRSSGARRALGAPAQRVGEHPARDAQVRVDRLVRAVAARRQAVGDRQQRDVDLDRRAGAQVGEHRAARERLGLVHEEAEAQVMARRAPRRARAAARWRAAARAPRAPARRRARRGR